MLSSRLLWFLLSLCISIFFKNVESRLDGEEIVGGDLAEEGQFPYQVYLHLPNMPNYICGGAIIDEIHVVTAAHCVMNYDGFFETALKVKVGVIDGTQCTDGYLVERISIPWQFVPTPYGKPSNVTHDIAVLELSKPLDLGPQSDLRAVELPKKEKVWIQEKNEYELRYPTYANEKAMISGYGWNKVTIDSSEKGATDRQLRYAESQVLRPSTCQAYTKKSPSLVLCAKMTQRDKSSDRGACVADSGSPLVVNNTLIGILSTSPRGCTEKKRPACYTRISYFMEFIKNAVSHDDDSKMRVAELSVVYAMKDTSANSEMAKHAWHPHRKSIIGSLDLPMNPLETYADQTVVISGFGWDWVNVDYNNRETGSNSDPELRFAVADVLTNQMCQQGYTHRQISEAQICAKARQMFIDQPSGVCIGDSRGSLFHYRHWSPKRCTERDIAAVYTRVSYYLGFIDNAVMDKVTGVIHTFELIPTSRPSERPMTSRPSGFRSSWDWLSSGFGGRFN